MTMSSDLSLMDFLFEREDPLQLLEKDSFVKNESDNWQSTTDEFLDSIFKFDDGINPFEMLDDAKSFSVSEAVDMSLTTSSCSESGLSSDQQLSPMLQDADDEDAGDYQLTSSGSEGSPNPNFYSNLDSPNNEEEVEIDSSVFDILDTQNFGDIIIEDDKDFIGKYSQPSSQETVSVRNIKSNSVHKLIRVTPVSGNPRSILLPVSLKNMKDIRAIKIFNPSSRTVSSKSGLKNLSKISVPLPGNESVGSSSSSKSSIISSEDESDSQYPRLQLTSEEKRLLQKEGVRLPSHYPLTKFEERELKRIRRKIRNKISAQDSRKRKKEYIDGLEDRVKQCTEENINLVKKIKVLQTQNQTMMTQLKRLHAALSRGGAKTAQPATCLMVLVLSMALVMMPNLGANQNTDVQAETEITLPENDAPPIAGRSRTLLFSKPMSDEGLCFPADVKMEENDMLGEMENSLQFQNSHDDHDYGPPPAKISRKEPVEYLTGSQGFIVPPIDDVWPPFDPYDLAKNSEVANKINDYVKEFKVNISDTSGRPARTVVVQVPKEK